MIDGRKLNALSWRFRQGVPFPHHCIDGFFSDDTSRELERAFPSFDAPVWHSYDNALEVKRTCNDWNKLPAPIYRALAYLTSAAFTHRLSILTGISPLYPDPGLNGGGLHIHGAGGKLNVHLDYAKHPKLPLARKLNLIVYLNSHWREEWGGRLGMWSDRDGKPGDCIRSYAPLFNRAVIFDTVRSWHGLPEPIQCPDGQYRKSLAVYYLTDPPAECEERCKARFAPTAEQAHSPEVMALIERRAQGVYA